MLVPPGAEERLKDLGSQVSNGRPAYHSHLPSHWQPWWDSYELSLLGDFRQPATLVAYHTVLVQFARFLTSEGQIPDLRMVQPDDIRRWMGWLKQNRKPTTANMRYRGLHSFFQWMVAEEEVEHHPMERIKPPHIPDAPVTVLREQDLLQLLKVCEGTDFDSRRDAAVIASCSILELAAGKWSGCGRTRSI